MIKQGYNPFLPITSYSENDVEHIKKVLSTLIEDIDNVRNEHKGKI